MIARKVARTRSPGATTGWREAPKAPVMLLITALLTVLVVAGCTSPGAASLRPSPAAVIENQAGSSSGGSQAPQMAAPSSATSSPTRALPRAEPDLAPGPTATSTPQPGPSPTATPVPSPTPTPMPALRQLTQGNCCTQPFWSPDSGQVLFIDKPGPELPTGIWGVDVAQLKPTPELLTERIAFYTPDLSLRAELNEDSTVIERVDKPLSPTDDSSGANNGSGTGSPSDSDSPPETRWELPNEGQPVFVSPGQTRVAWQISDDDLPSERRTTQVWVADLDGSAPRMVADLARGGFNGWVSDEILLLSSRESLEAREQVLFTLSLIDGKQTELARGERLRGGLLSPEGDWLAYLVALDKDPAQNGLWLVRSDGSKRHKLESDLFGAYQWRDSQRLLIVPFQPGTDSHTIWEFDADTGQTRRLTDPDATPFRIANADWSVSPDGRHVAFVESRDRNIWLLRLAD